MSQDDAYSYFSNTPAIRTDAPFTVQLPMPSLGVLDICLNPLCCLCCCPFFCCMNVIKAQLPMVRGIPTDAQKLEQHEVERITSSLEGHWFLQVVGKSYPGAPDTSFTYTDAEFVGTDVIFTGGMHNAMRGHGDHRHRQAVVNQPQRQPLQNMYRDAKGQVYVDFLGSILEHPLNPESGEIFFDSGTGVRIKMMKGWKRDGHSGPMGHAPPPSDPSVPPGQMGAWQAVVDPASGDTYYYNPATQETTWDAAKAGYPAKI